MFEQSKQAFLCSFRPSPTSVNHCLGLSLSLLLNALFSLPFLLPLYFPYPRTLIVSDVGSLNGRDLSGSGINGSFPPAMRQLSWLRSL